jgi:hypothetical protein
MTGMTGNKLKSAGLEADFFFIQLPHQYRKWPLHNHGHGLHIAM